MAETDPRPEANDEQVLAAVVLALEFRGLTQDTNVLALVKWLVGNREVSLAGDGTPTALLVAGTRAVRDKPTRMRLGQQR